MSSLNFTNGTFLEREELQRFQEFLQDNVVANAIIGNTTNFGIVQTVFGNTDPNFQVSVGSSIGTIQFTNPRSQAIDVDRNLIRLFAEDNIRVPQDGNFYWVRISYQIRRYETGTLNIDAEGNLTGIDTFFTQVLRGAEDNIPVTIRFEAANGQASINSGFYQIQSVTSDISASLLNNQSYNAENNLRYIVIGSLPIGELVSAQQRLGLYEYDSCNVELIRETITNTAPTLTSDQVDRFFYVARVQNNNGVVIVTDQRSLDNDYWQFNIAGLAGTLEVTRNLEELIPTRQTAQTNLGVFSRQETDARIQDQINRFDSQFSTLLRKDRNLIELLNKAEARTNLNVPLESDVTNRINTRVPEAVNELVLRRGLKNIAGSFTSAQFIDDIVIIEPPLPDTNFVICASLEYDGSNGAVPPFIPYSFNVVEKNQDHFTFHLNLSGFDFVSTGYFLRWVIFPMG
ncbi:hypothetical protein OAH77_06320 [Flavobacteriaceae bacterium]|nr:hypothetical protein [Flavobacteriaceae bacterium]